MLEEVYLCGELLYTVGLVLRRLEDHALARRAVQVVEREADALTTLCKAARQTVALDGGYRALLVGFIVEGPEKHGVLFSDGSLGYQTSKDCTVT